MNTHPSADEIIREARSWIGTPYVHQASAKGHGCDCLGLVRGIWRAFNGNEPQPLPAYSPDWGEVGGRETMLEAANRYFRPVSIEETQPGDLFVFRWKQMAIAKHTGIKTGPTTFIHAWEAAGVVETRLGPQWQKRIAAAFRFPDFQEQVK